MQLFVGTENSCHTMLKKLALHDSALIVEHDKFMSAYEGLEELHLHQSNVYVHDPEFMQDQSLHNTHDSLFWFWDPSDFSALKALMVLDITAESSYNTHLGYRVKWALHGFPCLQELTIVGLDLVIDDSSAELTGLQKLHLIAGNFLGSKFESQFITIDMAWQAMTDLQELAMCGSLNFNTSTCLGYFFRVIEVSGAKLANRYDNVDADSEIVCILFKPFQSRLHTC